ncbi:nitrate regulatory gene2 protein [Fagus crenata]
MGCVTSRIEKDERLQICRERKKLMKQLVGFRGEFVDAQLGYLRALKNTGVTLRQFTESELLELETTSYGLAVPPSPPPPLPPAPPPPPPFSPDLRKFDESNRKEEFPQKECIEIEEDDSYTPSHPANHSSWDNDWETSEHSSSHHHYKNSEVVEQVEDEKWAETTTEFEEEDHKEEAVAKIVVNPLTEKPQPVELVDDNSSTMGWYKDTVDASMISWRSKKTLEGIMKELDEYFLKASAGGKEIAVFMDVTGGDTFLLRGLDENKRKNSAKVFSALSWNWSSKSLQVTKEAVELSGSSEPCRVGAHCITLKKLYAAEQKLYKEMKEEEITKSEYARKSCLLEKQESDNNDWTKVQKTRSSVESLEADIVRLEDSISRICSSILELIDEELYPQLVALTSGLMQMWKTMYESHQVQSYISQRLDHLHDNPSTELSTDSCRQATAQLETEVTYWYNSFCKLIKYQREYVRTLSRWIQLTGRLADDHQRGGYASVVRSLCEAWQHALDTLPDKVTSEAIKSLLSAIRAVLLQQEEEYNLQKKSDKLEKRLQKEYDSLAEMEKKLEESFATTDTPSDLSPKHPLSMKRAKIEALKNQVESEKDKYLEAVQCTRTMTLNNLKTSLPNLFKALMGFSSASAQAIEAAHNHVKPGVSGDVAS